MLRARRGGNEDENNTTKSGREVPPGVKAPSGIKPAGNDVLDPTVFSNPDDGCAFAKCAVSNRSELLLLVSLGPRTR
jgi:hypothetical protein